jgi:rubredoxin
LRKFPGGGFLGSLCSRLGNQKISKASWDLWPLKKLSGGPHYSFSVFAGKNDRGAADGRYGFFGDFHCPRCGQKSEFMVLEFREPSSELMAAWGEIKVEELDEDILHCPKCPIDNSDLT